MRATNRSLAQRFLWHLRPPWKDKFCHEHWWQENPIKGDRIAIVWEVLRRHPDAEKFLVRDKASNFSSSKAPSIMDWFLAEHGLKSWQQLGRDQKNCRRLLSWILPQRGILPDPKEAVMIIGGPDSEDSETFDRIRELGRRFGKSVRSGSDADEDALEEADRLWREASSIAIGPVTAGHVLITFNPLIQGVEELVRARVREVVALCRAKRKRPLGRARSVDWLIVISDFEIAELSGTKRDDQLSARYRRIIGSFSF